MVSSSWGLGLIEVQPSCGHKYADDRRPNVVAAPLSISLSPSLSLSLALGLTQLTDSRSFLLSCSLALCLRSGLAALVSTLKLRRHQRVHSMCQVLWPTLASEWPLAAGAIRLNGRGTGHIAIGAKRFRYGTSTRFQLARSPAIPIGNSYFIYSDTLLGIIQQFGNYDINWKVS